MRLADELADRDQGPVMIRSGLTRTMFLMTGRGDEAGKMAEGTLSKVFLPLGMVDLDDIGRHLDEMEHYAGVRELEIETLITDLDAYFFGGSTVASQRVSDATRGPGTDDHKSEGEFVLDENGIELAQSADDDLEDLFYATEGRTAGTETILTRFRDFHMLMDRNLISP